jgi:hypothetical protein
MWDVAVVVVDDVDDVVVAACFRSRETWILKANLLCFEGFLATRWRFACSRTWRYRDAVV